MKRSICTLSLLFLAVLGYSQVMVGLRGNASSTWLLNKSISDAGDELDYKASFAGGIGVGGIYMFNEKSGVELDIGTYTIKQQLQGKIGDGEFVAEIKLRYTDIPILYKSVSETGFYFEVGPKISLFSAIEERTVSPIENTVPATDKDLNTTMISGVLGFGWLFDLNENLKLGTGLRFNYGFNDITTEYTREEYAEAEFNNSVQDLAFTFLPELTEFNPDTGEFDVTREETFEYNPTKSAALDLNIGLFYVFE